MLGRHARPCESFLVCIEICCVFRGLFVLVFVPLFLACCRFEWVSPQISLRERCMDALCTFVIDLVPSNAGKPLRFKDFRSVL
jgi:hypothetical protein